MTPSASPKSDPRELVFSESGRSRHIKTIDGLRGLALLMVLYQHIMAPAVSKQVIKKLGFAHPYLVENGWMGVSLFSLLSGFVLALPCFSKSRKMETRSDALYFYKRRAARLLPLFFFMAFVSYGFGLKLSQKVKP